MKEPWSVGITVESNKEKHWIADCKWYSGEWGKSGRVQGTI